MKQALQTLPTICPFTHLKLNDQIALVQSSNGPMVEYTFAPIGKAIIAWPVWVSLVNEVGQGKPARYHLAGWCREAKEREQIPPVIGNDQLMNLPEGIPIEFEDKADHFLRLLHDTGGRKMKNWDFVTAYDFPIAYAESSKEFYSILEYLIDENYLSRQRGDEDPNNWPNGERTHYFNVKVTKQGRDFIQSSNRSDTKPSLLSASHLFNVGNGGIVNVQQGANSIQSTSTGNHANLNIANGNNNTQSIATKRVASLKELTEQIKQALALDPIFDSNREEINQEIERIETQLQKAEPKPGMLKRAFESLKELASDSAGTAAGHAVVELVKQAPVLLATAGLG